MWDILDKLAFKIGPYIPFTGNYAAWSLADKRGKAILDIGCGEGRLIRRINKHKSFYAVGIDISEQSLKECRRNRTCNDCILCDARWLPIKWKSFDIVLCLEMVEHLEKKDGFKLIEAMEAIARNQVIMTIPVEWPLKNWQAILNEDPYGHKASWNPEELKRLGYKVRGVGLRYMRLGASKEEGGLMPRLSKVIKPLGYIVWVLAGPFVWFFPKLADHMVCTKNLRQG